MSAISKTVHIVPISRHLDRLSKPLEEAAADRVYILKNSDPIKSHVDINEKLFEEVQDIVEKHTQCYDREEVIEDSIDFYHFDESLVGIYEILYKEKISGNDIIVNISGGTRQVAIASAFACSFAGVGEPIYYVAENYQVGEDELGVSHGVTESPFSVSPLHTGPLNLEDKIPSDREKIEILLSLIKSDSNTMKEILVNIGEISKSTESSSSDRQKIIQKYHRHGQKMVNDGILQKQNGVYETTDTGNLIGKLLNVKNRIDNGTKPD